MSHDVHKVKNEMLDANNNMNIIKNSKVKHGLLAPPSTLRLLWEIL